MEKCFENAGRKCDWRWAVSLQESERLLRESAKERRCISASWNKIAA
jgi:hypothetical protein